MIRLIFTFFIFIFIHKNVLCNANQEMVIKYLTNFDTLESDFIQINNDGETNTGKILITRPGKIRIQYNENPLLIISDGKRLATINKSIQNITYYNLKDIPVSLLLYKNFEKEKILIKETKEYENLIKITLLNTQVDNNNFVEIVFEKKPFLMKKWTVFQDKFNKTEVLLNNLKINRKILSKNFDIDIEDPRPKVLRNF
jgi:outer membrane lipoprotein-sorting protein